MADLWAGTKPRLRLLDWGGSGAPLLLLHGGAGNSCWWEGVASRLSGAFRPVGLDFRGHGESGWEEEGVYDGRGFLQDIESARAALGWDRFFLAAHSLGARFALSYAADRGERLLGLVAVDFLTERSGFSIRKFDRVRRRPQPVYPDLELMLDRFRLEPPGTVLAPGALRELARRCVRKCPGGYTWKFDWRAQRDRSEPMLPVLRRIRLPVLVVRGEWSPVLPRPAFEDAWRALPEGRGAEVSSAHHHVPLDAPAALAELMRSFLGPRPPARGGRKNMA